MQGRCGAGLRGTGGRVAGLRSESSFVRASESGFLEWLACLLLRTRYCI